MTDLTAMWITNVTKVADYTLQLTFKDGKKQTIDFEPVIGYGWMKDLKNPEYFSLVRLNDGKNIEWPNGQDFNPEALYDWDNFKSFYIEEAKKHLKNVNYSAL